MRNNAQMQKLLEARERLMADIKEKERGIEALKNKLLGLDFAIGTLSGGSEGGAQRPRRNVKRTIMELINTAGDGGVTAAEIVQRAEALGRSLDRGSVSSLLSRFKREGVLRFDGERYYPVASPAPQEPVLKVVKTGNA